MEWSQEALIKIEAIPPFVRNMVKETIESYARDKGFSCITSELLTEAKEKFMGFGKKNSSLMTEKQNNSKEDLTEKNINIGELNRETSVLNAPEMGRFFAKEGSDPLKYAFDRKFAVHAGAGGLPVQKEKIYEVWSSLSHEEDKSDKRVIYIHIPFCVTRCTFCGFYMYPFKKEDSKRYVDALIDEITLVSNNNFIKSKPFQGVYLGGGTPTTLFGDDIKRLIKSLKNLLPLTNDCEITLEARVYDFDDEKIYSSAEAGINRYSIGVQTFDAKIRQSLGRKANKEEILTLLDKLVSLGHAPVIIDLIYGLPGQDFDVWNNDLYTIIDNTKIDGCDLYQLNIFRNGLLDRAIKDGRLPEAADIPTQSEMFRIGRESLYKNRFKRISMCHWSRTQRERNIYNFSIRYGATCIPLGCGSGGKIGNYNFYQEGDLDKYYEKIQKKEKPISSMVKLPDDNQMFREIAGQIEEGSVNFKIIEKKFNKEMINIYKPLLMQWEKTGLINFNDGIMELNISGEFWNVNLTQLLIDYYLMNFNEKPLKGVMSL